MNIQSSRWTKYEIAHNPQMVIKEKTAKDIITSLKKRKNI
jgi:hypothetical protein